MLRASFAAACAATLITGTGWAGPFEDAYIAYTRGDYAAALKVFVPLAEAGNADAEYSVGVMYANGRGMPRAYAEAAKWFRRAAEKGQAGAQYDLGVLYAKGQGVPEDTTEAAKWFRKAADQGKPSAQYNLGYMYSTGQGVPQDYAEAAKWYRKAADQGDTDSQNRLATLYLSGDGVTQDFAEAAKWYRKAAEQGDIEAQNELGSLYGNGQGVPQDLVEAYRWFEIAATRDAGTDFETHDNAVKNRDLVAEQDDPRADCRGAEARQSVEVEVTQGKLPHPMPDDPSNPDAARWTRAAEESRVQESHPVAVRLRGRHIALFRHQGKILACNNRCPHEGYPLVEGALDADCVLTCHWHNWKFDLKSGATIYGGDTLRTYPVKVKAGVVWLDLRDPPAAQRIQRALGHLDHALAEYDSPRIARELARLGKAGAGPEVALARLIASTHARLRDGMTHAYAAADAWLRLADSLADPTRRLACATEALAFIAYDTLREPPHPFPEHRTAWDPAGFAAAIEAQDENAAVALLNGALAEGLHFCDLEPEFARAALAHYNDFGHSLIYLMHVRRLVERLGTGAESPLLLAWLRSLIYATREDLLPDFRGYADALAAWPAAAATAGPAPDADAFEGQSVRQTLDATVAAAGHAPIDLCCALMEASARHLLRFDERHALRTDNSVADNVGWLDFSHALTFGHALRQQCARDPRLWPQGLLQLAMFVGRNSRYLDPDLPAQVAIRAWAVTDETAFHERAIATIVDHGIGLPIFPAHWLKTWSAVRDEAAAGLPAAARTAMLAAVNRLLAVRFKQRHALRAAHQALGFVAKEG